MVSKAREDLPLPLIPVMTTNLFRGMLRLIFRRLFTLAPTMSINSISGAAIAAFFFLDRVVVLLIITIKHR